ncbi:MAG: FecR domain-containing protein [Rubrivivax sp.]
MTRCPPATALDDDGVAQAAAEWIVRLSADDAAERDEARAGFEAWKRADPRHAAVAAGMERFIDRARSLGGHAAQGQRGAAPVARAARAARAALDKVLDAPAPGHGRIKRVARLLALTVALVIPAAIALRAFPPAQLLADIRTATGEQRSQVLADGTHLTLGTASAVNYELSPGLRRVELVSGEILVEVAKDAARPFVVETTHGRIRALGTRFIVRRDADATWLAMLESTTAVSSGESGAAEIEVQAGRKARLSAQGIEVQDGLDAGVAEDAFRHRRLLVQDRPLPEVLDELARYRSGIIRYERAQIEGIRVFAVLPLDDTDRALQLLLTSFPQLRIRTVTPWVVMVDLAR